MTQESLYLMKIKNELSVGGKNGIAFLLSASIIWTIITGIFLLPIEIFQKNIFMLFSTGLLFPLSVATWMRNADQRETSQVIHLGHLTRIGWLLYIG
ncbi:DUF7010 family protein [Lihuaxuella thermophila]|uniref:Uncharacterized protein n=1 Tax=Lihuaxuella thermophila TaxID=1173111 RepID=A0A1H8IP25_9BACL|nr:hypothetical protein [Lihuaxuella thermophila]SEN69717.1 hypothetical protein SAMN05444955_11849 [Lihuaxuella thermophila]